MNKELDRITELEDIENRVAKLRLEHDTISKIIRENELLILKEIVSRRTLEEAHKHIEELKRKCDIVDENNGKLMDKLKAAEAAQDICHGTTRDFLDGKQLPGTWSDGTDAACLGWWRGLDYGCKKMEEKLLKRAEAVEAENKRLRKALEAIEDSTYKPHHRRVAKVALSEKGE